MRLDRYQIVDEEDLRAAVRDTDTYVSTLPTERKKTLLKHKVPNGFTLIICCGTIAILFLTEGWNKLHLLRVAPICYFPILLMRIVGHWFVRSLEGERRWAENITFPDADMSGKEPYF